jgi:heat shock protein HslJ
MATSPAAAVVAAALLVAAGCPTGGGSETEPPREESVAPAADRLGDGSGREWQLVRLDENEPAPEDPRITLRVEAERVVGQSACNEYFAGLERGAGDGVRIGPVGATRMLCAPALMELERRYLERLGGAQRLRLVSGRLILDWETAAGRRGRLTFEPRTPTDE